MLININIITKYRNISILTLLFSKCNNINYYTNAIR